MQQHILIKTFYVTERKCTCARKKNTARKFTNFIHFNSYCANIIEEKKKPHARKLKCIEMENFLPNIQNVDFCRCCMVTLLSQFGTPKKKTFCTLIYVIVFMQTINQQSNKTRNEFWITFHFLREKKTFKTLYVLKLINELCKQNWFDRLSFAVYLSCSHRHRIFFSSSNFNCLLLFCDWCTKILMEILFFFFGCFSFCISVYFVCHCEFHLEITSWNWKKNLGLVTMLIFKSIR